MRSSTSARSRSARGSGEVQCTAVPVRGMIPSAHTSGCRFMTSREMGSQLEHGTVSESFFVMI